MQSYIHTYVLPAARQGISSTAGLLRTCVHTHIVCTVSKVKFFPRTG